MSNEFVQFTDIGNVLYIINKSQIIGLKMIYVDGKNNAHVVYTLHEKLSQIYINKNEFDILSSQLMGD